MATMDIPGYEGHSLPGQLGVLLKPSDDLLPFFSVRAGIPMILNVIQQLNMMEPTCR